MRISGDTVAQMFREAHDGLEAALAFVDLGGGLAADRRLDDVVDIGGVEPVARDRLAIDGDVEVLLAGDAVDFDVAGPADAVAQRERLRWPC